MRVCLMCNYLKHTPSIKILLQRDFFIQALFFFFSRLIFRRISGELIKGKKVKSFECLNGRLANLLSYKEGNGGRRR